MVGFRGVNKGGRQMSLGRVSNWVSEVQKVESKAGVQEDDQVQQGVVRRVLEDIVGNVESGSGSASTL